MGAKRGLILGRAPFVFVQDVKKVRQGFRPYKLVELPAHNARRKMVPLSKYADDSMDISSVLARAFDRVRQPGALSVAVQQL